MKTIQADSPGKNFRNPVLTLLFVTILSSCGSSQKTASAKSSADTRKADSVTAMRLMDSLTVMATADSAKVADSVARISKLNADTVPKVAFENYRAEATMVNQLIHTELHVSFNWEKQYMYGKATITLKPYFYPTDSLILDAKGMDIHEVSIVKGKDKKTLKYTYNNRQLRIKLDKTYTNTEEYTVFIDYISKPNEITDEQGLAAIGLPHKGLFFVNPDGKDKSKPRQIWTQGETEDNSCWFPTIDKPNQRQTEEIYMTVDKIDKTLSNGEMVSSVDNKDNTRTDHWVMKPGIPPYLVMMAVGPFSIIHDSWRGKPVDYYIDAEYAPYAKDIFGKTPQMIEFFSHILHFPYLWNKYDQVIVHDYGGGAMENTTATLHGDFMNKTRRELIDDRLSTSEDIISHELFHHWFGDMVTCESWSNITLNESFADYSESLWRQYAWGEDYAEQHLHESVEEYIESGAQHDLVYFYYNDREDVFDAVSYNKGGGILHMLRSVVGDTAFFDALHLYLETNKLSAAEVPQLRLAFQKVTGRDLNWFFNEWFFNKGYPVLIINHTYDAGTHKETVTIEQTQDLTKNPVFYMPIQIDLYGNGKKESHSVIMDKTKNSYVFDAVSAPDLVVADGKKMMLVCEKTENMSIAEREYQYAHLPLYLDRLEALKDLTNHLDDAGAKATMMKAMHDRFWALRKFAIQKLATDSTPEFKNTLTDLAAHDSSSNVRAEAISVLSANYKDAGLLPLYRNAINDSSYKVEKEGLSGIAKTNKQEALADARKLQNSSERELLLGIASVYLQYGNDSCNSFFMNIRDKFTGFEQIPYVAIYGKFLQLCSDSSVTKGIVILDTILKTGENRFVKYYAKSALESLHSAYEDRENDLKGKVNDLKAKNTGGQPLADMQNKLDSATRIETVLKSYLGE